MARDIVGTFRRALKKPPRYIAERAWGEAVRATDRWRAPARAAALTERRLLAALGYGTIDEAWDALLARPYPFLAPDITPDALEACAPGELRRIFADAGAALAHRVDLLGSGPIELGPRIDWHMDFKTGRRWPPAYCHGIDYANLDEPSDVKSAWELSRLQWLIPAGQAYRLSREEHYAEGVRDVLEQWIDENPYAGSVNWSCTMEAALRILTFSWFAHALNGSRSFNDPQFRAKLLRSLFLHGDFTDRYIERSDVNGNHFTADAAGLVFAGCFFGKGAAAERWLQTGWRLLGEEIARQVLPDGVDFEASVPYHRLVCELFALPALYGRAQGLAVTPPWRDRLRRMAHFTAAYTRPDGSAPVWGDADDARALPMAGKSLGDHRYLVGLVGLGLDCPELLARFSGPVSELAWTFGPGVAKTLAGRRPPPGQSEAFPDGGFYVLANPNDDHVFVDCGPVGLAGRGGHGHNDLMSFEAVLGGVPIVLDPGCYVYTASIEERNAFRSTAYHNTPQVAGEEINRFVRPDYLWSLRPDAEPEVRQWRPDAGGGGLEIAHSGYRRLTPPITPIRTIWLEPGELTIEDRFDGGGRPVVVPMHLPPSVEPLGDVAERDVILRVGRRELRLSWSGDGEWAAAVESARIAPSYGVVVPSLKLVWRCGDCRGARLRVVIRSPSE